MRIVRFNLELEAITPLICSGADKNSPKLPLSEIKAMMRFWYRAVREAKDRDTLKAEEGLLFKRPVGAAQKTFCCRHISFICHEGAFFK